ncbi:MAG: DUF2332 domain-containing protein [Novosphingobium sp.]
MSGALGGAGGKGNMALDGKAMIGTVAAVRQAYANQVAYCRANGSPVTGRVVEAIAAQLDRQTPGEFIEKIRDWTGSPLGDALPLRSAGALHALHLSGAAPELAPIYADLAADDVAVIGDAIYHHEPFLLPWLAGPPQTNEAGRSCGFIAGLLWLASQSLPLHFECLEIGSSAGINLMLGRYRYDLGGVQVGPDEAAMHFQPEWRGAPPPDLAIRFSSLKGCDVAPVDLADPAQALRLKAYIWPEHAVRFARLEAAIAAAKTSAPDLVKMNAADFIEQQLVLPQEAGTTRVLMHSIVWQYLPKDQQARITAAMEAAAAQATPDRPLGWISLEANRTLLNHGLSVRFWPGGSEERLLAAAHAHGVWLEWLAG